VRTACQPHVLSGNRFSELPLHSRQQNTRHGRGEGLDVAQDLDRIPALVDLQVLE
jgi:hypothetical protein